MPEVTSPIIQSKDLIKKFGSFSALKRLDLQVLPGQVHGFLGPNGAGKSTTIRILLGLLKKYSGTVELFGSDPWNDSVQLHKRLAYVPGDVTLWPNLTGGEAIDLLLSLRKAPHAPALRDELLQKFQLDPTKKCGTYSKGNRQKVAIVAALAADVELYILDEPTSGLDPLMQLVFNQEIKRLQAAGKTVLLSSHLLSEVETLCDYVTIIKDGQTVEAGSLRQLREVLSTSVTAKTERPVSGLEKFELHNLAMRGQEISFSVEASRLNDILQHLATFNIQTLTCAPPTLEELFLRHYNTAEVA